LTSSAVKKTSSAVKSSKPYKAPRTPWGDPDLQGSWPAQFNIPMSRPANLKGKEILSDEEFEQQKAQRAKQSAGVNAEFANQVTINPPGYWSEGGTITRQTSMVVDPPDGRVPPLTPEARKVLQSERGGLGPGQHFPDKVDSWEDFDYYSRCITRGFPSTMLYTIYNYGNDIIQSPGYVVIRSEMVHEQRVIPVSSSGDVGRPHVGKAIKTYMGSSVGHWEGDTLVVETRNFRTDDGVVFQNANPDTFKIIERFTRVDATTLNYEFTVEDPQTWTRPWTAIIPWTKIDPKEQMYEYACHEDNYDMVHFLLGARKREAAGIEK
jgi:hypothetical protein